MLEHPRKICHITTVHPLYDDRIFYKECLTLADNGYEVYLVVTHHKDVRIKNVNIKALPVSSNRFKRTFITSGQALIKTIAINPDSIHIHDPELLWMGICFRLLGKKTIYDVHEDIEKQILYKDWLGITWIRYIISKLVTVVEKFSALFFNKIIVVTEDIKKNFPDSKTTLLRNFPILDLINSAAPALVNKSSDVVIYIGNLSKERGILEIVNAIELLNAELWLLGKWESIEYEKRCKNANGWLKTKYFGEKELEEVYGFLKCSDAAVAMLYPSKNYLTSLPVKAFEYMALGIPMLLSDFPYWNNIFSDCAEFADPLDSENIAEKLKLILEDKDLRRKMSFNALRMINDGYSWEIESSKLISLYKELWNENQ